MCSGNVSLMPIAHGRTLAGRCTILAPPTRRHQSESFMPCAELRMFATMPVERGHTDIATALSARPRLRVFRAAGSRAGDGLVRVVSALARALLLAAVALVLPPRPLSSLLCTTTLFEDAAMTADGGNTCASRPAIQHMAIAAARMQPLTARKSSNADNMDCVPAMLRACSSTHCWRCACVLPPKLHLPRAIAGARRAKRPLQQLWRHALKRRWHFLCKRGRA